MHSTPRNLEPALSTIPSSFPPPSSGHLTCRPPLASPMRKSSMRPFPIAQSRPSTVHPPQQLQPVARTSRTREARLPLPFPSSQVFQRRQHWPIWVPRPDPNDWNEGQEAVSRSFRRFDRISREVIMYANDRISTGTALEEMAAKCSWYEDKLINDLQGAFAPLLLIKNEMKMKMEAPNT
ncbi:hypothetical protein O181_038609 [Austropuccinia psidii MF-1]|uniref:Uncharacterized protein n=1 Tax=Austropuccinia psidii MF-1 TaxID=1389203 RepID=A0A9Q3HDQ6_9BASI|nr:hypothetical protein [Austropuccinia psidii MF-1]